MDGENKCAAPSRLESLFFRICFWILLVTGSAKIASAFGAAGILVVPDPVLQIPYRLLFIVAGTLELAVAAIIRAPTPVQYKCIALFSFSINAALYRVGYIYSGIGKPCPCMGTLTSMLSIRPEVAGAWLTAILVFTLVGGTFCVVRQFKLTQR
jgi:hypothetical protein